MGRGISLGSLIYIIFGVIIAMNNGYLSDLSTWANILSAFLAIILWPLIIFGINLHLTF